MTDAAQPSLFDKPDPGPIFQAEALAGIEHREGVRWARYRPVHRVQCSECVLVLHERHGDGPAIRGARWRLTAGPEVWFLCHAHADLRRGKP